MAAKDPPRIRTKFSHAPLGTSEWAGSRLTKRCSTAAEVDHGFAHPIKSPGGKKAGHVAGPPSASG